MQTCTYNWWVTRPPTGRRKPLSQEGWSVQVHSMHKRGEEAQMGREKF